MRLLLICLCCFSLPVSAEDLHFDLQACLAAAPVNQDKQINLADWCPEYYSSLYDRGLLQTLEPLPGKQLSVQQLRLLNALIKRPSRTRTLDYSRLDELLAEILIDIKPDQSKTWWNSFLSWFKTLNPEHYEHEFQWLIEFLEGMSLSDQAVKIIIYGLFVLFSALVVGLICYECYIAGLFFRADPKRQIKAADYQPENIPGTTPLSEIKELNPSAQMAALLMYVIHYLTRLQVLPGNTSLTNQELSVYLQRHDPQQQNYFARLVQIVDPVLYGDQAPRPNSLEYCWQQVEIILAYDPKPVI